MAIQYVGGIAGSAVDGGNVSLNLTALTGGIGSAAIEGDFVLVSGGISDDNAGGGVSGWTEQFRYNGVDSTRDITHVVSSKFMTSSPDTSVTCLGNGNAGDSAAYTARVYRGVNATTPIDVAITSANGSSTNPDPPPITPATFGAWLVVAAAGNVNDASINEPGGNGFVDLQTATGNDTRDVTVGSAHMGAVVDGVERDAGAFGAWSSSEWSACTIALRPATEPLLAVSGLDSNSAETINIPSTAAEGDLAVLFDYATQSDGAGIPTDVVPTDWTGVVTDSMIGGGGAERGRSSFKILDGDDAGSTITGMVGATQTRKRIVTYRYNGAAISAVAIQDIEHEITDGNPSSKTVGASSGTEPLIVVSGFAASANVAPTFTVSSSWGGDGRVGGGLSQFFYRMFDTSAADVTVDSTDVGLGNCIEACYIEISAATTITGSLAATESGSDTAAIAGSVLVEGSLAATESGADTADFAGDVIVSGALDATETGEDTADFAGTVGPSPVPETVVHLGNLGFSVIDDRKRRRKIRDEEVELRRTVMRAFGLIEEKATEEQREEVREIVSPFDTPIGVDLGALARQTDALMMLLAIVRQIEILEEEDAIAALLAA